MRFLRTLLLLCTWLQLPTAYLAAQPSPRIILESPARIVVTGLSADSPNRDGFQIFVAGSDIPIIGRCEIDGNNLVFVPRYPFRPGMEYMAKFPSEHLETMLTLPVSHAQTVTKVAALYPTADALPENLLKFYLHFTAPMSRGDSYRHVTLLDETNQPVELPFVEIGEELWDERQQRLTLLLDPGRIKQGLKPHNEVGPPLVAGNSYTLVIDQDWLDANRQPLGERFHKSFRVGPSDREQPDPTGWRIEAPAVETSDALVVHLGESLDHALLLSCLAVSDASGNEISGDPSAAENETIWRFVPHEFWQAGQFTLRIDTRLEDLAGNSIQRAFEVNETSADAAQQVPAQLEIPFEIY